MTDIGHFSANNHHIKNPIEREYAPGPRTQYGQALWGREMWFKCWWGSLLHNECMVAIFFGGGSNNHPFEYQRQR
jgi:hypothetical protein